MTPADARAYLDLAREFGLRSIQVEDLRAEFWTPFAAPEGKDPAEDPGCPCGHPDHEHGDSGCLRGCDPAKCEAKT